MSDCSVNYLYQLILCICTAYHVPETVLSTVHVLAQLILSLTKKRVLRLSLFYKWKNWYPQKLNQQISSRTCPRWSAYRDHTSNHHKTSPPCLFGNLWENITAVLQCLTNILKKWMLIDKSGPFCFLFHCSERFPL